MNRLNDIWQSGKGKLPEDKLLAYLEGKLSPAEQHEVEAWLADEGMEADALEGLKALPANESKQIVGKLNYGLNKQLKAKTKKRTQPIKDNYWAWIAILIILILCIVGYMVLRMIQRAGNDHTAAAIPFSQIAVLNSVKNKPAEKKLVLFRPKYKFEDFKAETYKGQPSNLKFVTKTSKRFKTVLTKAYYSDGLNFGGHYCFVQWGCGSPCKASAIIDLKDGNIYNGPPSSLGYAYRADSRMIIINPPVANELLNDNKEGYYLNDCPWCTPEIWAFNEAKKSFSQLQ